MAIYKEIENGAGNFEKKLVLLPQTALSGSDLKFTKAQRTDTTERIYGNLFSSFNFPIVLDDKQKFSVGEYADTAFQYLNQDDIIVVEIPKNTYGELIDGKSINLAIPTTGGTVNVFSTFFKNSILDTAGQMIYSDPNQQSSQFGQPYNIIELPGQAGLTNPISGYPSNVAFLFSDSIQKPNNNSSYSWGTNNKYFTTQTNLPTGVVGSKFAANYSSADGTVDIPVGVAFLDKGFLVISHPTIVNSFNYSAAQYNGSGYTGNDKFANIYFTSGSSLSFQGFTTEFIQHAICLALPNEFYKSNNPTFKEAFGEDNFNNEPVAITEIALYNDKYECIAIAKTNKPLAKNKSGVLSFDIVIKV